MKAIGYKGKLYETIEFDAIEPMIDWNPQRPDIETPFMHLRGNQQCMGNMIQNDYNYLGKKFKPLRALAKMNTNNYYTQFEFWLKQNKLDETYPQAVYWLDLHTRRLNEILESAKIPVRGKVTNADMDLAYSHIKNTKSPIVFGITFGKSGHILMIIGVYGEDFVVTDPFGMYPYQQYFGHCIVYSRKMLQSLGTRMMMLESV